MIANARLTATLALKRPEQPRRDVCPHCKRETTVHGFAVPDGHWLETHHCAEHGDIVPRRSLIMNDHEPEASPLPVTTIENECEFRHLGAAYALRQRGAWQEFAAWRAAHPDFTSKELLDNWKHIRCAWNLSQPEKPRKPR